MFYTNISDYLAVFKNNSELQEAANAWDAEEFNATIAQEISGVVNSTYPSDENNLFLHFYLFISIHSTIGSSCRHPNNEQH